MIQLTKDITKASAITHQGTMHADEVTAAAFLELLYDNIVIMRTSEEILPARRADSIVFDIGKGEYDHHQKEAKIRANGIKYSAFGLLWQDRGRQLLEKMHISEIDDVFSYIDKDFVEAIDAIDNGVFPTVQAGYRIKNYSDLIKLFNPSYASDEEEDQQFLKATRVAKEILLAEISSVYGKVKAKSKVERLWKQHKGPILELPVYVPYEETLLNLDTNQEILFVVFPSNRGGYAAKAVPTSLSDHTNRCLFKEEWAGLTNEALQAVTQVPTARFCHVNRFLVTADTKEDILQLVNQCLPKNE